MADVRKKVVVRHFDGELMWGYLPAKGFLVDGACELLDPAGRAKSIYLNNIKTIAYVKDFNLNDRVDPERIGRKCFAGRPRSEGLWLRLGFRDEDMMEGLAHFDMGFVDALLEDRGLTVAPPDARSNTQRLFVPRSALATVEVLGFIAPPAKRKGMQEAATAIQAGLFGE